jgi:predicted dehydrogenase
MDITRRQVLVGGAAAALSSTSFAGGVFQDKPTIKVGLIGCGGRGSGAIRDNLAAESGAVVWSIADLFGDRLENAYNGLKKDLGNRCQVGGRFYSGFDAYKQVLATDVDVVILTTPPAFRHIHLAAAIAAGKHVFMEKPVAVDGPGIRSVIASAAAAKAKNLTIVAGTQRRHDVAYNECIKAIKDGAMGDVLQMNCYWNQGGLWLNPRQPGWSDVETQIRNWLYYTWVGGDHIVEQHVHNLDVCNWVMGSHPVKAISMGGRQTRTDAAYGHVFDHFATEYEYANGVKMMSYCRQADGCASRVSEQIIGSKGQSNANTSIRGEKNWRFEGDRPNPYVLEHARLYKSIKGSEGFNEGVQVAESTLTAIMGRMSAYSGEEITWEKALNSNVSLMPSPLGFNDLPVPAVAIPGTTKGVY